MPEKFTFTMPIKTSPSIALRQSLLQELPRRLPRWLNVPIEVMFLDPTSDAPSPDIPWSDAQAALNQHFAEQILTFIYFDTDQRSGDGSIVMLLEMAHVTVYDVTLPNASYIVGSDAIIEIFVELHLWLASNGKSIFIAGGNELEAGEDWTSEESNVREAVGEHLVEWLCCPKSRMLPHLDDFEIVRELGDVAVFRRRGYPIAPAILL